MEHYPTDDVPNITRGGDDRGAGGRGQEGVGDGQRTTNTSTNHQQERCNEGIDDGESWRRAGVEGRQTADNNQYGNRWEWQRRAAAGDESIDAHNNHWSHVHPPNHHSAGDGSVALQCADCYAPQTQPRSTNVTLMHRHRLMHHRCRTTAPLRRLPQAVSITHEVPRPPLTQATPPACNQ